MDLSLEAIDADLQAAETGGVSRGQIALVRARIRATLIAAQRSEPEGSPPFLPLPTEGRSPDIQIGTGVFGDSYAVPHAASQEDRIEAAARLLRIPIEPLLALFDRPLEGPSEPDNDGGTLDDLENEDDPDVDFFDEARKARKS